MSVMELTDIQTLKYVGFGGLSLFVIRELFKLVYFSMKQKKNTGENELKDASRIKIENTNTCINDLKRDYEKRKEHFYDMKTSVDEVHEIVTEKSEGVPLIYNKGLEKAVERLNNSIGNLTLAVKDLKNV